jgi:hypothetical protein
MSITPPRNSHALQTSQIDPVPETLETVVAALTAHMDRVEYQDFDRRLGEIMEQMSPDEFLSSLSRHSMNVSHEIFNAGYGLADRRSVADRTLERMQQEIDERDRSNNRDRNERLPRGL